MEQLLSFHVELDETVESAEERVKRELRAEGFGVLTRIDVKETFKEKLGEDFRPYVILGACNPPLAHRALSGNPDVGLLLPCNVVVEEHGKGTRISIVNPETLMGVGTLPSDSLVCDVASEARTKLERVAAALRAASG
jgi:uncharacterized protein (DUF302 family)